MINDVVFLAYLLEGAAAVCGFYYFQKNPGDRANFYFACFLLLTYIVESLGWLPYIFYLHKDLNYLREGLWHQNFWFFNPYLILSYAFYANYFRTKLSRPRFRKILKILIFAFILTAVLNLIFSDVLMLSLSAYTTMAGTFLILLSIIGYYDEILRSEKILYVSKDISFYFSVALLVFHLMITPFYIYFRYFKLSVSPAFVELYSSVNAYSNIFLYSWFCTVFLYFSGALKLLPKRKQVETFKELDR